MNRTRASLISLACATQLVCMPGQAAPTASDLTSIHHKLDALRQQHQLAESDRAHAADALRQSEQAISSSNRAVFEIQQRETQIQSALTALQGNISTTLRSMTQEQQQLGTLLRQLYVNGNATSAELLFNGKDAGQIGRNMTSAGYLARQRDQTIANLQQTAHQLDTLHAQQLQLQAQLEQQRQQRELQRQQLQLEHAARQKILKQLGAQIEQQQRQISTLEQNEKRITQLLQALARAAERRKRHPPPARHVRGTTSPENPTQPPLLQPSLPDNGLGLLKGHLPMPTHGELIHRFGTPREAGGTLWKGVFIKAPAGQSVISVAAGQVVFADWLRGFGNLIIIDHGAGYMSLYSDNETLYKRVGDAVKSGDVIASVGNTGGNNETGLYFELRYRSQAFDPDSWLKH